MRRGKTMYDEASRQTSALAESWEAHRLDRDELLARIEELEEQAATHTHGGVMIGKSNTEAPST